MWTRYIFVTEIDTSLLKSLKQNLFADGVIIYIVSILATLARI